MEEEKREKTKRLNAAERIEQKYGGKWEKAGSGIVKPPSAISTGSILLDEAIGECKGYPEGAIVEAFGPQHSGKTLMGYLAIAASQRSHPERDHLIIDAENQFRFQALWAEQVGVDVKNLFVSPACSAEEAFDKIEMAILGEVILDKNGYVKRVIKPGNFGVILIDSVTQLVPLEMVHKSMDTKTRLAALAAVMSIGLKKIVSAMSITRSKTILFFVNQTRSNPQAGLFRNPEVRTGGNSLPFYDTIAFKVSKVSKSEERDKKGKIFAHQVKIKFDKNKAGQLPAKPIIFRLRYDGTGIDNNHELFSVAEMNGLIDNDLVKKRKLNFFKPGTDELFDEAIEPFSEDEFEEVLKKHPKMKEMILNLIKDGSFYSNDEDFEEEGLEKEPEKESEEEKNEKVEVEAVEEKVEVEAEVEDGEKKEKIRRKNKKNDK